MFRSLMTIIREPYLYVTEVIFMLKHSVKLRRYTYTTHMPLYGKPVILLLVYLPIFVTYIYVYSCFALI